MHNNNYLFEINIQIFQLTNIKWVDLVNPTIAELNKITTLCNIPKESILQALDSEERPHIEINKEYIAIFIDIPIKTKQDKYSVSPLGIILTKEYVLTICLEETKIIKQLKAKTAVIESLDSIKFLLQILYNSGVLFVDYLQNIINDLEQIEQALHKSTKNEELFKLLSLQKSLTFFYFSLYTNELVAEKLLKFQEVSANTHPLVFFNEEHKDLLADVLIENKQAIAMAEEYSRILTDMLGCFASIISNNQNTIMKSLTLFTILLTVPVLFASFWGMNVEIPFKDTTFGFYFITSLSTIVTSIIFVIFWRKNFLK